MPDHVLTQESARALLDDENKTNFIEGKDKVIYPTHISYKIWKNLLYFFIVPIVSIITPAQIAFKLPVNHFYFVSYGASIFYIIDIIINFNSAFYNENGILQTDRKEIAQNYVLSGWLIVDFVCCFSFNSWADS